MSPAGDARSKEIALVVAEQLARARLPPRELYVDGSWFDAVRERVLARSWQFLAVDEEVAARESARPLTLLAGSLDEPLLLARDGAGELRLLSNVCTHRAHLVCEKAGPARSLRCPYHGRRFEFDGRCAGAPGFESAAGFPSDEDALRALPLERWGRLLFGGLAPSAKWSDVIEPVVRRLEGIANFDTGRLRHEPRHDRLFEFDANWCLYVENYLEGLHIPFIHPGLNAKLDWKSYRYENLAQGTLQVGVAASGEPAFELPEGHPDARAGESVGALYFWLFPNTMLNVYPWGVSLNVVEPVGVARTRVRFHALVGRPELHDRGAGSGLDQVELEDERAAAQVQRGMQSRLYRPGRYAPEAESGVHHFHRLLAAALAAR